MLAEPDNSKITHKVIAASRRQYATKIVASTHKKQQLEVAKEKNESESIGFSEEQQPVLHN